MSRSTLSRRALVGGVAVAAVASLAISTMPASAGTLVPSVRAQSGPASDISIAIAQQSPLLSDSSGTYILALLQNPSALPAGPSKDFAAVAENAADAVIGTATPSYVNHAAIAPGGTQAYAFAVPVGTDHVAITDPSGAQAPEIADPLSFSVPLTPTTDSSGYTTLNGTINNPSAYPQTADVTVLLDNAAGQLIGFDREGGLTPSVIAPGTTASYSDFLSPSQTAGVASYTAIVDGTPDTSVQTYIGDFSVQLPAYVGKIDTFTGYLNTYGSEPTSGKTVELIARTAGVTTVLATATTAGSLGAFTFHASPPADAQLSVLHPSDTTTYGTDSGDIYFPLSASLTVNHLKTKTLAEKKHKAFQITGTFTGFPGEKVYLELKNSKGKYADVTFTRAAGNGTFTFKGSKLIQAKAGKYTYRVEVMAQGFHGDVSSTFTVKVS